MRRILPLLAMAMTAASLFAAPKPKVIQWLPGAMVWKASPPPAPAGFKVAVLEGDPKKAGLYTVRAKFPPKGKLAPHFHPGAERVTVLEGSIRVGFGDKADPAKTVRFTAGSFYVIPAKMHHYSLAGPEGVVIQITGNGPWVTHFLKPARP
jgi:quercetin dioxygenase-like cupin family protein